MSNGDGCDTKIYERLNDLEISQGRMENDMEHLKKSHEEYRSDVKDLKKSNTVMEVRLGLLISAVMLAIHWLLK